MNIAIIKLELTRLRRSTSAIVIILFTAFASIYAVWSGTTWRQAHESSLSSYHHENDQKMESWLSTLRQIESNERIATPYDARPSMIERAVTQPVGALGHMAIGNTEILPARVNLSPLNNQNLLIGRYGFENPTTLTLSRFDLAFFIVVVLPLLMIALSFDIVAADRARGTINMLMAERVSKRTIIVTRLLTRNGILVVITALASLVAMFTANSGDAIHGLLWFVVLFLYCAFWLSLIYAVINKVSLSETTAASLVSLWAIFTFAIPALVLSISETLYPLPSNLASLSKAREAQSHAWKQYKTITAEYLSEHPELVINTQEAPKFAHAYFTANESEIAATSALVTQFALNQFGRSEFIKSVQYLSPAIITQGALLKVAGADFDRARSFQQQTRTSLLQLNDRLRPYIMTSNRISSEDYHKIPSFEFVEKTTREIAKLLLSPLLFLIFCSACLLRLGKAKKQYSPFTK